MSDLQNSNTTDGMIIETKITGIEQTKVTSSKSLVFAEVLANFLNQENEQITLGEVRETK